MKNRGYLHVISLTLLIWASLSVIVNPWLWLGVVALAGIYPIQPYPFVRYFLGAALAQTMHFFTAVKGMDHLDAMGQLFKVSGAAYLLIVLLVSSAVFALLATTIRQFTYLFDPKRQL